MSNDTPPPTDSPSGPAALPADLLDLDPEAISDLAEIMPDDPAADLPTVVIIGRPNVGKSTLFNRIVGSQQAIVENRPGITRDRKELEAEWLDTPFLVVDTGGWMPGGTELEAKVSRQVEEAVKEADVVLFVIDASVALTDDDQIIANWVRRTGTDVLVIANKADNQRRENDIWEYMALGLGDPLPLSALHGRRSGDMLDKIVSFFPARIEEPEAEAEYDEGQLAEIESLIDLGEGKPPPRVAIVGRPNVGKSTLFNQLVGTDRAVVHDLAGTTRDAIDTLVETDDGPIVFVDTAGMRKRGKIDDSAEYYSLVRALRAIDNSDIALLVIDATIGVTGQDQRLSERVDASGCPIIIVLNKWELVGAEDRLEVQSEVSRKLAFLGDAPVLKISALSGKNVQKLHPLLQDSIRQYHQRVPTKSVNKIIGAAQQAQRHSGGAKVLYAVQGATDPPTFTLFVNRELDRTYLRYLERRLREDLDMGSTPIKLRVRKRS